MVNYAFNNRLSQFLDGDTNFDESFSRNDSISLLNRLLGQINNYQLNIKIVVEKFAPPEQNKIDLAVILRTIVNDNVADGRSTAESETLF